MSLKACQNFLGGILIGVVILLGLVWANPVQAQAATLSLGKVQPLRAPTCLTQEDMVPIAMADSEGGIPKALEALKANSNCGIGQGMMKPVRVVFSAKTERGATVRVLEVQVELDDGTTITVYVMVDVEVIGLTSV